MTHQSYNRLSVNLRFSRLAELESAFEAVADFIAQYPSTIAEIDFKIFWKKSQLSLKYEEVFNLKKETLQKMFGELKIHYSLPFCMGDAIKAASFPNCERCPFLHDDSCQWPRQMTQASIRAFETKDLDNRKIIGRDFEGANPLAWYYPERSDFVLLNTLFKNLQEVVDYNCEYGFASELLLREGGSYSIQGVESRKIPLIEDLRFSGQMTPQIPKNSWGLFSSAEFNTNSIESNFAAKKPELVALIHRQNISGLGGENITLNSRNGELTLGHCDSIFDPSFLKANGYQRVFKKYVNTWDSLNQGALEIFCLQKNLTMISDIIELHQWKSCLKYPWEENPTIQSENQWMQKSVSF